MDEVKIGLDILINLLKISTAKAVPKRAKISTAKIPSLATSPATRLAKKSVDKRYIMHGIPTNKKETEVIKFGCKCLSLYLITFRLIA